MGRSAAALHAVANLLGRHWDVLGGRVIEPEPLRWCVERGWQRFLLGLTDAELERAESLGLVQALPALEGAPASLCELARDLERATAPGSQPLSGARQPSARRPAGVKERKHRQILSLAEVCRAHVTSPARIVDFGSGHGHLTRELARQLGVQAVGVERDVGRVRAARTRARREGLAAEFAHGDGQGGAPGLAPGALAVGLHACGELGDAVVRQGLGHGCHVLLVSCCLQKIPHPERRALSRAGQQCGLDLPQAWLGLSNVPPPAPGGARSLRAVVAGHEARRALYLLLRERGVELPPGDEVAGINRQRFRHGVRSVAAEALARRGLAPPSDVELRRVEAQGRSEHGRMRRLRLPRDMLGRLLEHAVVLDRACLLEEQGRSVRVGTAFGAHLSPRNLALVSNAC